MSVGKFSDQLNALAYASVDATNDLDTIYDDSATELKYIAAVERIKRSLGSADVSWMTTLAVSAIVAADDKFLVWDASATAFKVITGSDLLNNTFAGVSVGGLTALTLANTDTAADYFLVWDNSATAWKKIIAGDVNNKQVFNVKDSAYGAVGNDSTDDTAAIRLCRTAAAAATYAPTILFPPGIYLVTDATLLQLFDGLNILGYGATIHVASTGNTYRESALSGNYYDNGLIYQTDGDVDNVTIKGLKFDIDDAKIGAFQIGTTATSSGSIVGSNITIEDTAQDGGVGPIIIGSRNLTFRNNRGSDLENGMLFWNNEYANVTGNHYEYIGVNRAETAWQNVSGFIGNNNKHLSLTNNRFEATGGSAVIIRAEDKPIIGIKVQGNTIVKAGNGGIACEVASYASASSFMRDVNISDNVISGFLCGVLSGTGASDHDGIAVGGQKTLYTQAEIIIANNLINYMAPTETWNSTDNDIDGFTNPKKERNNNVGTVSGIQVYGADTSTPVISVAITGNQISHCPQRGITVYRAVNVTTSGNNLRRNGYQRDTSTNTTYSSAHGIFSSTNAMHTIADNNIFEQNPGVVGSASITSIVIYSTEDFLCHVHGNTIIGNDTATAGSAWNNAAISTYSASATCALTGFTSRPTSTIVSGNKIYGTYYGLSGESGTNVRVQAGSIGQLMVKDDDYVVAATSASLSVEKGVTMVYASRTSTTQTITLPDPTYLTGTRVNVKHAGLGTGLVTIATAAGTLWPATPTLANTGEYGTWQARGTVWERVA